MTATQVHGVEVIADQPARSNLTKKDGSPVFYRKIRQLLLADGTETFGCVYCDYTGSINQVRPHFNRHSALKAGAYEPPASPPRPASNGHTAGVDVKDLIRRLKAADSVTQDRDRWRERVLAAERDLTDLRRIYARTAARKGGH